MDQRLPFQWTGCIQHAFQPWALPSCGQSKKIRLYYQPSRLLKRYWRQYTSKHNPRIWKILCRSHSKIIIRTRIPEAHLPASKTPITFFGKLITDSWSSRISSISNRIILNNQITTMIHRALLLLVDWKIKRVHAGKDRYLLVRRNRSVLSLMAKGQGWNWVDERGVP